MPSATTAAMRTKSQNARTCIVRAAWATSLVTTPAGPGYHPRDIYRPESKSPTTEANLQARPCCKSCNMVGFFVSDAWLPSPPLKPTRSRAPRARSGAIAERKRTGGCARLPLLRPAQTAVGVPVRARHKARAPLAAIRQGALAAMPKGSLAAMPKARWRARRRVGSHAQSPLAAARQGARGPRPMARHSATPRPATRKPR